MFSEEHRKQQNLSELWLPYDKEEKVPRGMVLELDIPIWPSGIAFEVGESMRLEVIGQDHRLHECSDLDPLLENPNEGIRTVHTSEEYPSQILLPLMF
jgi:predicted acyl esterase